MTQEQAKELGVYVLPKPFYINEKLYFEDISLTQPEFYQRLAEDAEISTSQPAPGDVLDAWRQRRCWRQSLTAEFKWSIISGSP